MSLTTKSNEELLTHLITLDYKGKEYKTNVLNELLQRAYSQGVEGKLLHVITQPLTSYSNER